MTRGSRSLSDEELALWRHVTRSVTAYHPSPVPRAPDVAPRHPTPEHTPPLSPAPRAPASPRPLALGATEGLDRRSAARFARGQMAIEGRLDLHGMTLREAHAAVTAFIRSHARAGARCLLVVTGKGQSGGSGEYRGRIRAEALHWLDHPTLRPLILAVREARQQHGGGGALYVLLKRQRQN